MVGACWTLVLLKVVLHRQKGLLHPWFILTWMAEKEEAKDTEVHDGLGSAWFGVILQVLCQGSQDCEVNGPDL